MVASRRPVILGILLTEDNTLNLMAFEMNQFRIDRNIKGKLDQ